MYCSASETDWIKSSWRIETEARDAATAGGAAGVAMVTDVGTVRTKRPF
jgi:hypothetical protein